MSVLLIGTCRVHSLVPMLREAGIRAWHTTHRLHSTIQVLELLQHLRHGGKYDERDAHVLSEAAFKTMLTHGNGHTIDNLKRQTIQLGRVSSAIIEISSFKESFYVRDGREQYVNHFTKRDLADNHEVVSNMVAQGILSDIKPDDVAFRYSIPEKAFAHMAEIRDLMPGIPVTWVSHANVVDESERFARVREARDQLANIVSEGAKRIGHRFFDPTSVVRRLGQHRAFEEDGEDTNHFTAEMFAELTRIYGGFAAAA